MLCTRLGSASRGGQPLSGLGITCNSRTSHLITIAPTGKSNERAVVKGIMAIIRHKRVRKLAQSQETKAVALPLAIARFGSGAMSAKANAKEQEADDWPSNGLFGLGVDKPQFANNANDRSHPMSPNSSPPPTHPASHANAWQRRRNVSVCRTHIARLLDLDYGLGRGGWLPAMWQQLFDLAGLLGRQASQDVLDVSVRIMAVHFGGLDEAHDSGCTFSGTQ